jgi:hypothetical protein
MGRAASLMRGSRLCLLVSLGFLLGMETSGAQTRPSDMPRNLIEPMVPYEQGIANIRAQDAAKPKAVQPVLPGDTSGLPKTPGTPGMNNRTTPAEGSQAPH